MNEEHEKYMRLAIKLARKGLGRVNPNPLVGAVIVKDNRIIGQGWHQQYGGLHAERNALAVCTEPPAGATIYVTLEPCCHHGANPPCTEAVIQAGVSQVVTGSGDPNPLVAGKGIARLRAAGIQVEEGILRQECDQLNFIFFHYITTGRPYVALKYAMSADGKIACRSGQSRWITGEKARRHAHRLRNQYAAVMVGVGTVLADDPELTCRLKGGSSPLRIVCDSQLRLPLSSKLAATSAQVPTVIATCSQDASRHQPYLDAGCQVWPLPERDGRVDLQALMQWLGERKIDSLLVEGGGQLNWSLLEAGLVQRVYSYIAPKLLGGETAKSPVEGHGVDTPPQAFMLKPGRVRRLGQDLLIESEIDTSGGTQCSQE